MRLLLFSLLFVSLGATIYFLLDGDAFAIIVCLVANNFLTAIIAIQKEVEEKMK